MFERDGIVDVELGLSYTAESGVRQHDDPFLDSIHEKIGAAIVAIPQLCAYHNLSFLRQEGAEIVTFFPKQKTRITIGKIAMIPVYFTSTYTAAALLNCMQDVLLTQS